MIRNVKMFCSCLVFVERMYVRVVYHFHYIFLSLVRACFVGPKISIPVNETRPPSMVHSVDYPLDGGKLLRVEGQIRCDHPTKL